MNVLTTFAASLPAIRIWPPSIEASLRCGHQISPCRIKNRAYVDQSRSKVQPYTIVLCLHARRNRDGAYEQGKAASSQRVYVPEVGSFFPGTIVSISPEEQQHLRARRMRKGTVTLFNGVGGVAHAVLNKDGSSAVVTRQVPTQPELVVATACFAAPSSSSRADWAVEKLTELGAARVLSLCTARSEGPPSNAKLHRWTRLAVAASKQCMGYFVPEIDHFGDVRAVATAVKYFDYSLLLTPNGPPILQQLLKCNFKTPSGRAPSVLVLAGPEGGFTEEEETLLVEAGCMPVALGNRRLRIETAIMSALATVRYVADMERLEY